MMIGDGLIDFFTFYFFATHHRCVMIFFRFIYPLLFATHRCGMIIILHPLCSFTHYTHKTHKR